MAPFKLILLLFIWPKYLQSFFVVMNYSWFLSMWPPSKLHHHFPGSKNLPPHSLVHHEVWHTPSLSGTVYLLLFLEQSEKYLKIYSAKQELHCLPAPQSARALYETSRFAGVWVISSVFWRKTSAAAFLVERWMWNWQQFPGEILMC